MKTRERFFWGAADDLKVSGSKGLDLYILKSMSNATTCYNLSVLKFGNCSSPLSISLPCRESDAIFKFHEGFTMSWYFGLVACFPSTADSHIIEIGKIRFSLSLHSQIK